MTNKHCIIATIGRESLHREWMNELSDVDLHLIVYDDSYETFRYDSPYVSKARGAKFQLIGQYLSSSNVMWQYEYFYLPDDDILIDSNSIRRLFKYMRDHQLMLAQPAIGNYYVSHWHTMKRPASKFRYTNFVEIMQPCFSREALQRVLFTFSASKSGWGIDLHWPMLLDWENLNMAIIDDIVSFHMRPVRSNNFAELAEYIDKYDCGNLPICSFQGK